ncbi:unnamed protein product [Polarella glacialis]|uniref:Glutamine amidotransferase type-2 domain-containing protein n=1 Tax=Polarella glacialis TaxID=89957 RepID=A0A813I3R5_POLGL|nr:unnamed protein product [Polarella glacialis]CAE8644653.1 unnamed protein product [Polarella glacialis]
MKMRGALVMLLATLLSAGFHWPTGITLLWFAGLGWVEGAPSSNMLFFRALSFELAIRFARAACILLHELAHVAAAALLALLANKEDPVTSVLHALSAVRLGAGAPLPGKSKSEEPGHSSLVMEVVRQLVPGAVVPGLHLHIPSFGGTNSDSVQVAVVRHAGLLFSLLLPLHMIPSEADPNSSIAWATFLGSLLAAAGALLSDLPGGPLLGLEPPAGIFCCGNWGLLVPRSSLVKNSELLPKVCWDLLNSVIDVVEMRGAQAGGLSMFLGNGHDKVEALVIRVVKTKRGYVADMLVQKIRRMLAWRSLGCGRRLRALPVVLIQGHTRFGTSSAPAEKETHPHRWLGDHMDTVWKREPGQPWHHSRTNVCVTITHNGDFDGWLIHDKVVPIGMLGEWLSRLFHHGNAATGDSPKMAGVMDLLVCQGRWNASVRLAFVKVVLKHVEQLSAWMRLQPGSPNVAPKPSTFAAWARVFEHAFASHVKENPNLEPDADFILELGMSVRDIFQDPEYLQRIVGSATAMEDFEEWEMLDGHVLQKFIVTACQVFFENDLLRSVCSFFQRAEGTFGVSVTCSIWPDKVVLAAKGQPVSVAIDPARPLALWASETSALAATWPGDQGERGPAGKFRFDIADASGEAIELLMMQGSTSRSEMEGLANSQLPGTKHSLYFTLPGSGGRGSVLGQEEPKSELYHILLRGTSLESHPVPLLRNRFVKRLVHLMAAPPIKNSKAPNGGTDIVESDLQDVPSVLSEIDDSWEDCFTMNRMSGVKFANCLGYLINQRNAKGPDIDVLVIGIENSLWMGQQFAADLSRLFPRLNVMAMSSNWVLGMLQPAHGHIEPMNWALPQRNFKLSPHAVVLACSQSGTTYPTVWAARLLSRTPDVVHIFGMSGDFDTVLARSISDGPQGGKFTGNLFSTLSGTRPAEPSTLATMAMHHTLTQLLVFVPQHLQALGRIEQRQALGSLSNPVLQQHGPCRGSRPACELRAIEIRDLTRLVCSLASSSQRLVGCTIRKVPFQSKVNQELLESGDYISAHLTEGYWAIVIAAVYVYVTVTAGVPLVSALWVYLGKPHILRDFDMQEDSGWLIAIKHVLAFVDSTIYVFMGAIVATIHRGLTGRRLWTRYCARTLVIVDSTVNYKLLRAFVSKLRALAFRFTTFGVAGQNGGDHFVHEMTHLATSDIVLAVGRQDGRIANLAAAEQSTLMSVQQARFISAKRRGGVEAISVGHNPWVKPKLFAKAISLPTHSRPVFLSETLLKTRHGPHAPGDVGQKVAELAQKHAVGAQEAQSENAVPWVEMEELLELLGGKVATVERAKEVVKEIIISQAENLGIESSRIDVAGLFPEALDNMGSRTRSKDRGNKRSLSFFKSPSFFKSSSFFTSVSPAALQHSPSKYTTGKSESELAPLSPNRSYMHSAPHQGHRSAGFATRASSKRSSTLSVPKTTALQVMAVMRGRKMEDFIRRQQKISEQGDGKKGVSDLPLSLALSLFPSKYVLKQAFMAWDEFVCESKQTKTALANPKAYWYEADVFGSPRRQEELRRNAKRLVSVLGLSRRACFLSWASWTTTHGAAEFELDSKPRRMKGSATVGGKLVGYVEGQEMIDELRLLETLYESRVGAAERLLSFFVLFHRAVKPLSRLPWMRFDLDRSESRLRVASTPAPVAFVEELPPTPKYKDAVARLQSWARRRPAPKIEEFSHGCPEVVGSPPGPDQGYLRKSDSTPRESGMGKVWGLVDIDQTEKNPKPHSPMKIHVMPGAAFQGDMLEESLSQSSPSAPHPFGRVVSP